MMFLGPEFQRQLWIRFSSFSLMLMPLLVGTVAAICFLIGVTGEQVYSTYAHSHQIELHWSVFGMNASIPIVFISLMFVGTQAAASSFTREVDNKTWDLQRMSSIRPIELVVGKVFGVTSYAWYMASGFLVLLMYGYMHKGKFVDEVYVYPDLGDAAQLFFAIISSALVAHIVAALVSVQKLSQGSVKSSAALALGFFAGICCFNILTTVFDILHLEGRQAAYFLRNIEWFGMPINKAAFGVYSLLFFLIWAVIGLHRLVRSELSFQSYPFVWLAFLTTLSLYVTGLYSHKINEVLMLNGGAIFLYLPAFFIFLTATYLGAYRVASDLSHYQRFFISIKNGKYKRALESVPDWMLTLAVSFVLAVIMILIIQGSGHENKMSVNSHPSIASFLLALILFTIRDGIVVHICFMRDQFKNGGVALIAFYIFAYFLLPTLIFQLVGIEWDNQVSKFYSADYPQRYILCFFYPIWQGDTMAAILPVLLQIAGFGYIFRRMVIRQMTQDT